jgi:hypothetical protein
VDLEDEANELKKKIEKEEELMKDTHVSELPLFVYLKRLMWVYSKLLSEAESRALALSKGEEIGETSGRGKAKAG